MLTTESLDEAIALTQNFDSKDIILEPIDGSPLSELVKQTVILPNDNQDGFDLKVSSESTNVIELGIGGSSHDVLMDEIVKVGADSIRKHITYAKNVVAPLVGTYIDLVESDITQLPVSGLNKFEIQQYCLPEVYSAPGFVNSLSIFKETPFEEPGFNLNLPDLDQSELLDLLNTGSGSIDGFIEEFKSRVGIDFIYSVYNTVFQLKQNTDSDYSQVFTLRKLMDDKVTGNDFTLVVYLLANKLHDNPPENTDSNLSEYNSSIIKFRNQAGNKLYRIQEEMNSAINKGRLVKNIVSNHTVQVYAPVYEEWVNNDGDNTVLLGSLISEKNYYTVDNLAEDAENLKLGWDNYKRLEEKAALNNRFVYVKESLGRNFNKLLLENEEITLAEKSTCSKIFKEELALISLDELSDICAVCLKLMSRSMFYTTDAERILTSIDRNCRENPSITPREAALIATVELLTDWVCSQMKPVSAY